MNNKEKVLLILERASGNLDVNKDSGDYVLEGIFAQFGVMNNNKRIYEEKEYLPHLDYLKKQISESRLMGELDHPEKFEVSLTKVSHIVESLEYDSKKRQIVGRLRLLDTPSGQIAKNLVDSGIPISISSRAAGSVSENNKVQIKRIFTYDLVAHPGFENAQLSKVNESFGLESDDNIQIFDASQWSFEPSSSDINTKEKIVENNNMNENKNYVTVKDMQKYSENLKNVFEKLQEEVEGLKTLNDGLHRTTDLYSSRKIMDLESKISNLESYSNYIATELSNSIEYSEHIGEELNNSIKYSEYIKESITDTDTVKNIIDYLNEEIAPNLNMITKHNDYIVEEIKTHIKYSENTADIVNKLIEHNDYLATEIEENRNYAEFIAENATSDNEFGKLVEYTEYAFKNAINESGNVNPKPGNNKPGNNKSNPGDIKERFENINNKIDAVLEGIQKEKIDNLSETKRYPFLTILDEDTRAKFNKLDETKKQKVGKALLESAAIDKQTLSHIFESKLDSIENSKDPKWLSEAPEKYLKIYESLDNNAKSRIIANAAWYAGKLETNYQIKNFWETRGLDETVQPVIENLNENLNIIENPLGYGNATVNAVAEALRRKR